MNLKSLVLTAGTVLLTAGVSNAAIISNGTVSLGVDRFGQLNDGIGVEYIPTGNDGTISGCPCEGWGVADSVSGVNGWANNNFGGNSASTSLLSYVEDGTNALSKVLISDLTLGTGVFEVTHDYKPSDKTDNLYEVLVTVKNVTGVDRNFTYRRVMDWDIEPTAFSELVTIKGTSTTSLLKFSNNGGFSNPNPLIDADPTTGGLNSDLVTNIDFEDVGPVDHGTLFDFDFGILKAGESRSFNIYYGAAGNEEDALSAIGSEEIELYSLGQTSDGGVTGEPNTFIFGFKGVGGRPVVVDPNPKTTPEPSLAIALGLVALTAAKSKKFV
jgi:hypothetical protein